MPQVALLLLWFLLSLSPLLWTEGSLADDTPTPTPTCTPRSSNTFTDNCNGTVSDSATGLMWEKKTDDGTIHDKDNEYSWTVSGDPWPADGTLFTSFLSTLNAGEGFAGYVDWRLPSQDGCNSCFSGETLSCPCVLRELETILLAPYPCGTSPCLDSIFGVTNPDYHWSSTVSAEDPDRVYVVGFDTDAVVFTELKSINYYKARAVRGVLATPAATTTPTPTATCTPRSSRAFVDNCDGVVVDNATGLMWEKKTTDPNSGQNYADPHDVDNTYTWTQYKNNQYFPDGSLFTFLPLGAGLGFLAQLNDSPCFAGYCDWRMPEVGGRPDMNLTTGYPAELESLLLYSYWCPISPCLDPIFGPTQDTYWSNTEFAPYKPGAWTVDFFNGFISFNFKDYEYGYYARAVRGSSIIPTPTPTATPVCVPVIQGTYTDNCNGTISDSATGLMWEKKTTAVGSGVNLADPHDVDNSYTWNTGGSPYQPNGAVFTDFLSRLNAPPCFAGYCDWRLPLEEGRNDPFTGVKELEGLLSSAYPCTGGGCINSIFGPTGTTYWSATDFAPGSSQAWVVDFSNGLVVPNPKDESSGYNVRAVRP